MQLSEVFNSQSVALNRSEVASNRIPYLGEAFFPNRKKMGLDLKWIKTHKGLGVALKPSNFDAIPTVRPRGEANITREEMPLFRESMVIKEHDMMEISRAKDANDPYVQPVLDSIYDDTNELLDGADISTERMRMQLLAPIDGNMGITIGMADNTKYTYNYDSDGEWKKTHYVALSGTATWDKPTTAKPLTDIRNGIQYLASNGIAATTILGNSATFDYLLENEQIKAALLTISGQAINFVDDEIVKEVLRRKLRVNFVAYDKMYIDYDGNEKKFYPDDYITILGGERLGFTWSGTTPEELTTIGGFLPNGINAQAPVDISVMADGTAIAVKNDYKPAFAVTTTASRIALPSFEGMDGVYVIKVK